MEDQDALTAPDPREELVSLAVQVRNHLEYLDALGVKALPRVPPASFSASALPNADESLETVRADLGQCTRCRLCRDRQAVVFGEGPPDARLIFVGEGPGEEEDAQGRPFVGPAGQLLTDIIVKGMKMRREDVYIANIVKCRPPHNRTPQPDEAETCLPFLRRQIAAIRPKVIVALGRTAARYLLGLDQPLGQMRNRFHDLDGLPVMVTYHPAALLRHSEWKRDTWEDIKLVMDKLKKLP